VNPWLKPTLADAGKCGNPTYSIKVTIVAAILLSRDANGTVCFSTATSVFKYAWHLYLYICRLRGVSLRTSPQMVQVLGDFLQQPKDWQYGYDSSRNAALKSGTLYPILTRLAEHGILAARWEHTEPGKPPRHMYRLTADGLRYPREQVPSSSKRIGTRPATLLCEPSTRWFDRHDQNSEMGEWQCCAKLTSLKLS